MAGSVPNILRSAVAAAALLIGFGSAGAAEGTDARGLTPAGQFDMSLLFICYRSDLSAGFATVQARLDGEPSEEYVKPVGGGSFFVLPAGRSGMFEGARLAA